MPRYFFDVHNIPPVLDDIGQELSNDEAAWREAIAFAGQMFRDANGKVRPGQEWALDVADQNGKPLFLIRISTTKLQ